MARRRVRPPSLKLRRDKEMSPLMAAACISPSPSSPASPSRILAILAPLDQIESLVPLAFCAFPRAHWPSLPEHHSTDDDGAHGGAPSRAFPRAHWPSLPEHHSTDDDGAHGGAPSRAFPQWRYLPVFSLELSATWRKCHEDRMALEDYIRRLTVIKHLT